MSCHNICKTLPTKKLVRDAVPRILLEVVLFNCLHQFGQAIVPRLIKHNLYVVSEGIFLEEINL